MKLAKKGEGIKKYTLKKKRKKAHMHNIRNGGKRTEKEDGDFFKKNKALYIFKSPYAYI